MGIEGQGNAPGLHTQAEEDCQGCPQPATHPIVCSPVAVGQAEMSPLSA
jgi:hypothetical protein